MKLFINVALSILGVLFMIAAFKTRGFVARLAQRRSDYCSDYNCGPGDTFSGRSVSTFGCYRCTFKVARVTFETYMKLVGYGESTASRGY